MDSFLTPYGLSNSGQEKLQFTPFGDGPKPVCSNGLCTGTVESHNFFVLGHILVKFYIGTRLIESFRTIFRTWWCGDEKLHFTPVHSLRQLKRDEGLFPPLPISLADRNGLKNLHRQILGRVWSLVAIHAEILPHLAFTHTHTHTHTHEWNYILD